VADVTTKPTAGQRELIGLSAIGNYLGMSASNVRRLQATAGLLLYRRRLQRVRPGCRGWAWTSTPQLLTLWQVSRCAADRPANPTPTRNRRKASAGAAGKPR
jgi:hypothetical protein